MTAEIIRKYLNGQLSQQDAKMVAAWIDEKGEGWLDDYLSKGLNYTRLEISEGESAALFARVMASIDEKGKGGILADNESLLVRKIGRRKWLAWVAAASVLLMVGLFWKQEKKQTPPANIVWQYIRNDSNGASKKVTLPDGSLVILNSYSSIGFSNKFNDSIRDVVLEGEAYFDVAHNATKPFVVKAGRVSTRVYGTAFNIDAYPKSSQLRIALKRGRIGVKNLADDTTENILEPGELLLFKKDQDLPVLEAIDGNDIGAWTEGKIYFYKTPLADALNRLENLYGVKFVFKKGLRNATITASFEHAKLGQVLQHLSFVWGIRFTQNNADIYVE